MKTRDNESIEIDIKELFFALLHRLWIIILAGILGSLIAGAYGYYLIEPTYSSTTKVYVINRQEEDMVTYSDLQSGIQLTKDYMILVKSQPVTEQVIKKLGLNISNEELAGMIQVNTPEETRILEITVTYTDPYSAKEIVDAIAEVSSEQMVNVMDIQKVNIVELGNLPMEPASPNIQMNTLLGGLIGAFILSAAVVVLYLMNDTIKTAEDIEKYLCITTLGTIPLEEGYKKSRSKKRVYKRNVVVER